MTEEQLDDLAQRAGLACGCVDEEDLAAAYSVITDTARGVMRTTGRSGADRIVLHYLDAAGILEHGVSLRGGCWLSTKGNAWLSDYTKWCM